MRRDGTICGTLGHDAFGAVNYEMWDGFIELRAVAADEKNAGNVTLNPDMVARLASLLTPGVDGLVKVLDNLSKSEGFCSYVAHGASLCPRCMSVEALAVYRAKVTP